MTLEQRLETAYQRGFDDSYRCGRAIRIKCSQCDARVINCLPAHEHGCPNQTRSCDECGAIVPKHWRMCADCAADVYEPLAD